MPNGWFLMANNPDKVRSQLDQVICLAFPYYNHIPPEPAKFFLILSIPYDGASELWQPVFLATGRCRCVRTAWMPMPEATMHKNHGMVFRKDDVRLARHIIPVQAKPEAELVEEKTHPLFRCRIGREYATHDIASFFGRKRIHRTYPIAIFRLGSVSHWSIMRL